MLIIFEGWTYDIPIKIDKPNAYFIFSQCSFMYTCAVYRNNCAKLSIAD